MANSAQAVKKVVRQRIKTVLLSLSTEEKLLQSNYVTDKLIQNEKFSTAARVGIYLSLPDEIQTDAVLKHIFSSGKICFIPRYNSNSMAMIKMESFEERNTFPKTEWNIPQPSENDVREEALQSETKIDLAYGGLDVIVVPGRAFTKSGCRLGRGKGYYDKYLNNYLENADRKMPYMIGLAFLQQIVDELPVTHHDIKMNEVIYDNRSDERFSRNKFTTY